MALHHSKCNGEPQQTASYQKKLTSELGAVTEVLGSLGGMTGGEGASSLAKSVTGGGGGRLRRKLATEALPPPFIEVPSCKGGGGGGDRGGSVMASPLEFIFVII